MAVINVTSENLEEFLNSDKTILLDFYATWCGPCKMISPIVDKIADEHPEYLIGKVDVDAAGDVSDRFEIMSVPTLVVLKNGEVAVKTTGIKPKEKILEMLSI